jgi:hypothetical protein
MYRELCVCHNSGASLDAFGRPHSTLWVPVILELRHYRTSDLLGLLPRFLRDVCLLSDDAVRQLREGIAFPGGTPRLLVFCEGFDELQGEAGVYPS